ncbi:hypothetical protein, partial [Azospirillum endophyticum]
ALSPAGPVRLQVVRTHNPQARRSVPHCRAKRRRSAERFPRAGRIDRPNVAVLPVRPAAGGRWRAEIGEPAQDGTWAAPGRPFSGRWRRQRLRSAVPEEGRAGVVQVKPLFHIGFHSPFPPESRPDTPLDGLRLAERRRSDDPSKGRFSPDSLPIPPWLRWGRGRIRSIIRQNGDVRRCTPATASSRSPRIFRHNDDVRTRIFRHNGDTRTRPADAAPSQVLDSSRGFPACVREMPSAGHFPKTMDRRATARTHFKKGAKTALTPSTCAPAGFRLAPRVFASVFY